MFRVDPKTVTRWAKAGKLTSIRTLGGHRRYRETEVRALLAGIPPAPPPAPAPRAVTKPKATAVPKAPAPDAECPNCLYKIGSAAHKEICGSGS